MAWKIEHGVREHTADAKAVRSVQDEACTDQLGENVQTDDGQQATEHEAVPVIHLPLMRILPQNNQQHRHPGDQIM